MYAARIAKVLGSLAVGAMVLGGCWAPGGPPPATVQTLDQHQDAVNATPGSLAVFTTAAWAQTFTAGLTGQLDRVEVFNLELGNGNLALSPLTAEIRAVDSDGKPTGPALGSGTLPVPSAPVDAWLSVTLTTSASVVAGTSYALVLTSPASTSTSSWAIGFNSGNPYPGGAELTSNTGPTGPWLPSGSTGDMMFRTYVTHPV